MEKGNSEILCHFCLQKTKFLKSIFDDIKLEADSSGKCNFMSLKDFAAFVTNTEIKPNTKFPRLICIKCNKQMENFMKFRITCLNSLQHLNDQYGGELSPVQHKSIKEEKEETNYSDSDGCSNDMQGDIFDTDDVYDQNDQKEDILEVKPKPIYFEEPLSDNVASGSSSSDDEYVPGKKKKMVLKTTIKVGPNGENEVKVEKVVAPQEKQVCTICGGSYVYLVGHMKTHSADRGFSCEICGMLFKEKTTVKNHIKNIHEQERNHVCDICGKAFFRLKSLRAHRVAHLNEDQVERNFKCKLCPLLFITKNGLRKHEHIHSEARPFECATCGKRFRNRTEYIQHTWIHTGEKPYSCTYCDARFRTAGMRRLHEIRVHKHLVGPVTKRKRINVQTAISKNLNPEVTANLSTEATTTTAVNTETTTNLHAEPTINFNTETPTNLSIRASAELNTEGPKVIPGPCANYQY